MVGSSKILTVSYGTFSCTLEGFEDSFSTMKAIAEYFRDLAADDRYFGAEPASPDAEMLARIAEREIARRVDVRKDGASIVLRAGAALSRTTGISPGTSDAVTGTGAAGTHQGQADADRPAPQAVSPYEDDFDVVIPAKPVVAAPPTKSEKAAPAETPVASVSDRADTGIPTVAPVVPSEALADGQEDIGNARSELLATAPAGAPVMPPAVTSPAAAAQQPTPRVAERAIAPAHPDAESVAAKLQRIRAVVGRSAPNFEAAPIAPKAVSGADAGKEDAAAAIPNAGSQPLVLMPSEAQPAAETPNVTTAAVQADPAKSDRAVSDGTAGRIEARVIRMRRTDFEAAVRAGDVVEDGETVPDMADVATAVPSAGLADTGSSLSADDEAELLAELAALEEDADIADEQEALFDDAPENVSDFGSDPDSDPTDDTLSSDDSDGALDSEPDLDDLVAGSDDDSDEADLADRDGDIDDDNSREAASLAAIAATLSATTVRVSSTTLDVATTDVGFDDDLAIGGSADSQEDVALRAVQGLMAAPGDEDEDDFGDDFGDDTENLFSGIDETDDVDFATELDDTLDDQDQGDISGKDEAKSEPDPQDVVPMRPRRVVLSSATEDDNEQLTRIAERTDAQLDEPENRSRREAIHQLKAAVVATEADRRAGEIPDEARSEKQIESAFRDDLAQVVRPRRPTRFDTSKTPEIRSERPRPAPLKLVASQRVDSAASFIAVSDPVIPRRVSITDVAAPAQDATTGFAEFAKVMGAHELADLLEAAAAYTSFIEGSEDFSRPQLMSKVQDLRDEPFSREDGLRSFGALLRQGRITKVRNGRFAVSGDTRFNPERRVG